MEDHQLQKINDILKQIKDVETKDFGNSIWLVQLSLWQQINIHSHLSASKKEEKELVEKLTDRNFVKIMVKNLILSWVWRCEIKPKLEKSVQKNIRVYFSVFSEIVFSNILATLLFNNAIISSMEEFSLDLADYCLNYINKLCTQSLEEEEIDVAFSALHIIRYLVESGELLPPAVPAFLMRENDLLILLSNIIEKRPWFKTTEAGRNRRVQNSWILERPDQKGEVDHNEAQVWLSVYSIYFSKIFIQNYELTEYRKHNLLSLRKLLNELVLDQIPVLSQLCEALSRLSLISGAHQTANNPFIIRQIPTLKTFYINVFREQEEIQKSLFKKNINKEDQVALDLLVEAFSFEIPLVKKIRENNCENCGKYADKRCSRCKIVWYCSRECQVNDFKTKHKTVCKKRQVTNDIKLFDIEENLIINKEQKTYIENKDSSNLSNKSIEDISSLKIADNISLSKLEEID